jgi:hypothetical protein
MLKSLHTMVEPNGLPRRLFCIKFLTIIYWLARHYDSDAPALAKMVGLTGFEPATFCIDETLTKGPPSTLLRCATELRYNPRLRKQIAKKVQEARFNNQFHTSFQ